MIAAKKNKGTIGVIGLGIMGGAFAKNLRRAGWRVVGYDISAAARRADAVADHAPAGPAKVFREGPAHDTEADHADRALVLLGRNHSIFPIVKIYAAMRIGVADFIVVGGGAVEWAEVVMRLSSCVLIAYRPAKAHKEEPCISESV